MKKLTIEGMYNEIKANRKQIGEMLFDNMTKIKSNKMIERRLKERMIVWNESVQPLLERRSMPNKTVMKEYYRMSEVVKQRVHELIIQL